MYSSIFRSLTVFIFFCCFAKISFAQADGENIRLAQNALDVSHICDNALNFLKMVSDSGKNSASYNLCMGRTQDCKLNTEQAIYYYSKYLDAVPSNDSVKKRIAELKDNETQRRYKPNEERIARIAAEGPPKHRRHRHNAISEDYASLGAGYIVGLGTNAPYKSGVNIGFTGGYPIMHSKAVIETSVDGQFMLSPNTTWFANAFSVSPSDVSNVDMGCYGMFHVGFYPVLINEKKQALTAGAFVGFSVLDLGSPAVNNDDSYTNAITYSLNYGVKVSYFLGHSFICFLQLNLNTLNSISTTQSTTYINTEYNVPISFNTLVLSACYRFER